MVVVQDWSGSRVWAAHPEEVLQPGDQHEEALGADLLVVVVLLLGALVELAKEHMATLQA